MKILPLSKLIEKKIKKYNLQVKFSKQLKLLCLNPKHPSLKVELLEPKEFGIYSFRIDRKFRGLFIFREDKKALEIINITVHYH
jgi:Txe/YoeB family toxin of Txe-Axe toxin-antitoxin module